MEEVNSANWESRVQPPMGAWTKSMEMDSVKTEEDILDLELARLGNGLVKRDGVCVAHVGLELCLFSCWEPGLGGTTRWGMLFDLFLFRVGVFVLGILVLFWNRVSFSLGRLQTQYVAKVGFELRILLSPPPESWDYRLFPTYLLCIASLIPVLSDLIGR